MSLCTDRHETPHYHVFHFLIIPCLFLKVYHLAHDYLISYTNNTSRKRFQAKMQSGGKILTASPSGSVLPGMLKKRISVREVYKTFVSSQFVNRWGAKKMNADSGIRISVQNWCSRGDLNPHEISFTSTSSLRVCLFRHDCFFGSFFIITRSF